MAAALRPDRLPQVPQVPPAGPPLLPTLSVLRLGSNRISVLADGSFWACPALTQLYLDHNAIGALSQHTFSGLGRLEVGRLATGHPAPRRSALIGSPRLQILELSSNRIQVLPELLLRPLPAIELLFLEGNQVGFAGRAGSGVLGGRLQRLCALRSRRCQMIGSVRGRRCPTCSCRPIPGPAPAPWAICTATWTSSSSTCTREAASPTPTTRTAW